MNQPHDPIHGKPTHFNEGTPHHPISHVWAEGNRSQYRRQQTISGGFSLRQQLQHQGSQYVRVVVFEDADVDGACEQFVEKRETEHDGAAQERKAFIGPFADLGQ